MPPDSSPAADAVLITGAGTRIGRVIAETLAKADYDILLHYHQSAGEAEEAAAIIRSKGRQAILMQQDLQDTAALPGFMAQAFTALPHLNGLVHNAAIFDRLSFREMTLDAYERHMAINLTAPLFLTQAFTQHAESGCIIAIADTHITQDNTAHFPYLLSKKALVDFTRMAAHSCAPHFRVHALCPGIMLPSPGFDAAYMVGKAPTLPLQRLGTAEELAGLVTMLLQRPELTGQCLFLDGGEQLQ